jgi:hypothetical protein
MSVSTRNPITIDLMVEVDGEAESTDVIESLAEFALAVVRGRQRRPSPDEPGIDPQFATHREEVN